MSQFQGVIFDRPFAIKGHRYRRGEFAQLPDELARSLVRDGVCTYADGRPVEPPRVTAPGDWPKVRSRRR